MKEEGEEKIEKYSCGGNSHCFCICTRTHKVICVYPRAECSIPFFTWWKISQEMISVNNFVAAIY